MKGKFYEAKRLCAVVMSIVMALPASTSVFAAQTDVLNLDREPVQVNELTDVIEAEVETAEAAGIEEVGSEAYEEAGNTDTGEEVTNDTVSGDTVSGDEVKKEFSDANIEVKCTVSGNIIYDGTEKKPEYVLTDISTKTKLDDTEYSVKYEYNTDPGWAIVTFTSKEKSYKKGEMYEAFYIEYNMDAIKAANTEAVMSSVSGNILVKNPDKKFDIYAYVIAYDDVAKIKENQTLLDGTLIGKDTEKRLSSAYVMSGTTERRVELEKDKKYTIFVSLDQMVYMTNEGSEYSGLTELGNVTVTAPPEGGVGDYKDGSVINFKANIQKNQDVKLSWAPDKKVDADFANYASYEVYGLNEEGKFETKLWPAAGAAPGKAKTCMIKATNAAALESGIVMLRVFDKGGVKKAEYLTAVAPFLFDVQGGDKEEERRFTFSDLNKDSSLSFELQAALKDNKETSYTADLTCQVPSEGLENISYSVTAKQKEAALRAVYYTDHAKLAQDTKYFFRVRTVYNYYGLKLVSAPSNAIGMNVGPALCEMMYITGSDPQKMIDNLSVTTQEEAYNGIHADSDGTCWKKGYVMFVCPINATDANVVRSVELLRSNDKFGIYKSAKKYNPAKQVTHINGAKYLEALKAAGITGVDENLFNNLYYVEFNNFPPEETWFYKIRVISKKGSVGGTDDGYENTTKFEKVQDLIAMDTGLNTIEMGWKHDDCAKQYWVYRVDNETGVPTTQETIESRLKEATKGKPLYKVNGGTYKKSGTGSDLYKYHFLTDKNVVNGREYHYLVRPVYNAQKDGKYEYDDFAYSVGIYTHVVPTGTGEKPKSLKSDQYNMLRTNLRWSAVTSNVKNKIMGYRIQRMSAFEYNEKDPDASEKSWKTIADVYRDDTDPNKKKAFNNRVYRDESIESVGAYLYRVCGLYAHDVPETATEGRTGYSDPVRFDTKPLPVGTFSATKQNGYDFRYGANVRFTIDKKDMEILDNPKITMKYKLEYSDNGRDYYVLTSGDVSPYQATYSYKDDNDYLYELRRGVNRRYRVTLSNGGTDEYGLPYESQKQRSYQKPTGIDFGDGDRTIVVGDTRSFDIKYENGTVCELDGSPSTSNSSVVKIESWDNGHVEIKAVGTGYAKVTIKAYQYGWGGGRLTRDMEIHVIDRTWTPKK